MNSINPVLTLFNLGFLSTILVDGGFLLTAVPNWTATPPVQCHALALLCLLWISGWLRQTVWLQL